MKTLRALGMQIRRIESQISFVLRYKKTKAISWTILPVFICIRVDIAVKCGDYLGVDSIFQVKCLLYSFQLP